MNTLGVVLAAGAGVRFGGPKAPFVYEGVRLVDTSVANLRSGGCDRVMVVLGAWIGVVPGADEILINPNWENGISSSLRVAIEYAIGSVYERMCLTLVDLPGLTPLAITRILASESGLATATYRGAPTHPVVITREHWSPLLDSLSGDTGARNYLRDRGGLVEEIAIDDVAVGDDLDFQPT